MKTKLFLTGLILIAATAIGNAQQGNGQGCCKRNGSCKGTSYVDKNNNSVCDNAENLQKNRLNKRNGTGNCNGTGQGRGNGQGKGKNFADINKNGICDTFEARSKK